MYSGSFGPGTFVITADVFPTKKSSTRCSDHDRGQPDPVQDRERHQRLG